MKAENTAEQAPGVIRPPPAMLNGQVARSLEGLHGTVSVPPGTAGFWRQYRAFVGPAVLITALDVLLLLALQGLGMRFIETVILVLVATIGGCYFIEIFVLPQTQPSFGEMGRALLTPGFRQEGMIVVAIGIIGATVMPHNLYLHSALVQSRKLQSDEASIRSAIRFNTIDSITALTVAFFVNAAILVLAATVFYGKTSVTVAGGGVV